MAIAMQRFCINRKIAPALSIEAFFRLVNRLGLNKVELRNDLPSGKVTDDLSHQQVRELAARYHIEILTINAVYPFNRRSEEVRQLTESLLKEAQAIGAKSLVLCPLNDGSEVPASETLGALRDPGAAVRLLWHPRPGGAAGLPAKLAAFCTSGADADPRRPRAV